MKSILYYRPEIVAFYSGAAVMIFELLGSRIVGPYIWNSLFVWTSLIAIILWALSLWYYYWWKISDRKADLESISLILLLSSMSIFLLLVCKDFFLITISTLIIDIRFSSSLIALVLFAPTSFLLWMLSPIVTKMRLTNMQTSWWVVGAIGSIGTVWSIIGTLLAGFVLIPLFWVTTLMILLSLSLILLSIFCEYKKSILLQTIIISSLLILLGNNYIQVYAAAQDNKYTYDTPYSHIQVSERRDVDTWRYIRDLTIDNVTHAWMYTDTNELVYDYTKHYHLFDVFLPDAKNILMLWWAAYSFPKSFLETYDDKNLDVVEIDSDITEIAKKHFRLKDHPRLSIYHQDARVFLNTTKNTYDAILWDAFGSYFSIPYQLTTHEIVQKKYDLLSENGIVILNIVSSISWEKAKFLEAEYKTYSEVFPEVFIIPVRTNNPNESQNIMLIAAKNKESLITLTDNPEYQKYLTNTSYLTVPKDTNILTDDYAPVDSFISEMNK
jgi:spermidine synthase